ncbi:MAG: GNAT family N-acetyltransferase [Phycisphaerales bacterium]|nr:GNAT family N-acetyltransferase [Planctomycetota bacterium]MCH8507178.1 GNAT family N-acetyltransferase [Phycisphaerales bacterium]
MSNTIREITDDAEWDALVDRAELGTVYHRSGWLGVLNECTEARIHRIALEGPTGLLAIWPIGLLRKGPLRIGGSPLPGWNTAYLGPLFANACEDKADAVRRMYAAPPIRKPAFLATRVMDTTADFGPLGFRRIKDFETYEIDLTESTETLWGNLKGTCRTRIRKGEKNGLEIREEHDDSYLDEFMTMASDVFAKTNKKPPFSKYFLKQVDSRLRARGELLVTSAFHGSDRIATLIVPHDRRTAMYFAGVSLASRLDLAPNNLLHWQTISRTKVLGISSYDFISSKGSPGRFKATFGPNARSTSIHWEHTSNIVVEKLKSWYETRMKSKQKTAHTK